MFRWRLLDAQAARDRSAWISAWERSPMQLPFAHPGFGELFVPAGGRLLAALMEGANGAVLYPFILREVEQAPPGTHDIISPYGYGGPLHWGVADVDEAAREFWSAFDAWAKSEQVVSEFIRFSLFEDVLPYPGLTRPRNANYVRELPSDSEALWAGVVPKVRQNVRKAMRAGLTTMIDESGEQLDEFLRIYTDTMARRGSDEWYLFDRAFFERLHTELPGRMIYVYAVLNGVPVSVDLLLLGASAAYYFLGGTDSEAFRSRPNELVKTEVMEWLRQRGYQHYVLGGGVSAGDGLERYKRGFAPVGARIFCSGERVLDSDVHAGLVESRQQVFQAAGADWDESLEFFPPYRRPLPVVSETGLVHS